MLDYYSSISSAANSISKSIEVRNVGKIRSHNIKIGMDKVCSTIINIGKYFYR